MSIKGFFLALEGGEGSGKSTLARSLEADLTEAGHAVIVTREPGGTPVAEAIRHLLLTDGLPEASAWCEALLFAAARAEHVSEVIRPALERGEVVICDRFVDSSVAYQGVGRGLGVEAVRQANEIALGGICPDLTVVLDIDPKVGLLRAVGHNRMEARTLEFHRAVRDAFLDFATSEPNRYLVVDAAAPHAQVLHSISTELQARLARGSA